MNEILEKRINFLNPHKEINILFDIKYSNRFFPEPNIPIDFHDINGGYTYVNGNEITIVRHEECNKVVLHELLHHNPLIHVDKWKKKNIKRLMKHFNIHPNSSFEPNEAVVEFWATIMHLYFVSKEYNLDMKKLLDDEIKHSLFKSHQLLCHLKDNIWYEKSNAFSYIIFKTIILSNLKAFIKIYEFPYDDTKITDFLIKYSPMMKNKLIKKNPFKHIPDNSLRIMIYSDL